MSDKLINRLVAVGVFFVTLAVYMRTLSTTVVFWDVGEFCAAAWLMQVPHPPGSPFFLILSRVASMFPFREDIAARMHAVSALSGALAVMFLYLVAVKVISRFYGKIESTFDRVVVYGSSAIGSLALAFTTTFWDNSTEAEVYGMAIFLASAALWLALRWWERADEPHNEKYLLLIAYMLGLSTGIHLLTLLTTIPILMMVYFRKYEFSRKSFIRFGIIAGIVFLAIYPGVVQYLPSLLDGDFKGMKSELFPFIPPLLVAGAAYYAYRTLQTRQKMLHIACLSFLLIILGYSTYVGVIIRANVPNIPMNENNPNTLARLTSYIGREQYGDVPMLKGESWDNSTQSFKTKMFPRRYSGEPLHEATRVNYENDGDFFWRYQVNHMFIRYVLWNFVGQEGDWQDAGVSWKRTLGIPFLMALFGLYYQWKRDWKMGLIFLTGFIIMGMVLALYQNQQDPQPRERDYFYVGAYYVLALWISIGIVGIISMLRKVITKQSMARLASAGVLSVSAVAIPGNLLRVNWYEHDRSQEYIAWDYSYNLLQSCDEDAILFTNGDNDTFPLWYLQDVEGIRRDIRIVNLSLVNTSWYIRQLKHSEPHGAKKVKISLTDEQIERIQPVRWTPRVRELPVTKEVLDRFGITDTSILREGKITWQMNGQRYNDEIRYLRNQDIMVDDIIRSNKWDRPIYFAVTSSPDSKIGLDNYLWMEGLTQRLRPMRAPSSDGALDIALMEANFLAQDVVPVKTPQSGFLFRNLNNPDVYYDENVQRMMMNYRAGFLRIADYATRIQNDREKARLALAQMDEKLPLDVVPMQDWRYTYYIARSFHDVGDEERAQHYGRAVEEKCLEMIDRGQIEPGDGSTNPYWVLSEIYSMRKDYSRAIEMLNSLALYYPNTPWIKNQIDVYERARQGAVPDPSDTGMVQ